MDSQKAAVFILLGQSNAVGHGIPMKEEDKILTPFKNVFGLHRKDNQRLHPNKLIWKHYTSDGMNLAEEQDHTYSIANCLAAMWQQQIDQGKKLPNLYIIHIAIGAQGVTKEYMWYPEREEKLIPGQLGTVDISLFPFTMDIFSCLKESLKEREKDYEILGLHWRGGENDMTEETPYLQANLLRIYQCIFDSFNAVLENPPIVIHEIHSPDRANETDPTGKYLFHMHYINSIFKALEEKYDKISLFDVRKAPFYEPDTREKGIFEEDAVHYTPKTNQWVAKCILEGYIRGENAV